MSAAPEKTQIELVVDATAVGKRLDAWLAEASGLSRTRIKACLERGDVSRADGETLGKNAGKRTVAEFERYVIAWREPEPVKIEAQDIPLDIVFEDENLLVVNKSAGLVVHPAFGHPDGTLVNAVLNHCPSVLSVGGEERPGIVHRLDRDTSGLMVVAKTDTAMKSLGESFRAGLVHKTYLAISCGVPDPPSGRMETLIGRSPVDRKKMAVLESGGKNAITEWEVAEDFGTSALLRVRIHTGRTHQIRVHMAWAGCPLAGDRDYGSETEDGVLPFRPERQMLHAWRLSFPHPVTGQTASFEAAPPEDFTALLAALRAKSLR